MLTTRALLTAGCVGLLMMPARAAGQMPVPGPVAENSAKEKAMRFERSLRGAIELAGERLAQQARQVAPGLTLELSEPAIARGVQLDAYGFYFDVQAPNITSTMMVLDMMMQRRAGPQTVSATTVVPFDPDKAYTSFVKDALIDTLLDESAILSLSPGEHLTVAVSGIDSRDPNPLNRMTSAKLVLTILATDLIDLRQGRITREQAKDRITQKRF